MTEFELKLECLKLAMEQAKRENKHADRESVAKISAEFYNHVTAADKSPFDDPGKTSKKR